MTGVDTNILVRYVMKDDEAQVVRVRRFLAESRAGGEPIFVSTIVLCETVWVLRTTFGKSKPDIQAFVESLLATDVFRLEEPDAVLRALDQFRAGGGDFAD